MNYSGLKVTYSYPRAWNNGKSRAKLDLTSLTTPGLQIHKFDHTRTANPCDWLPCCRAVLLLVDCSHSLVKGLIFCISATLHLGTSFPLFHDPTPYMRRHQKYKVSTIQVSVSCVPDPSQSMSCVLLVLAS